jgi:hypothetical protein
MKGITANRLDNGRVVYRNQTGAWVSKLREAATYDSQDAEAALQAASKDAHLVVGAYLIDIAENAPAGRKTIRERIRLTGPSAGSLHTGLASVSHVSV